MKRVIISGGAGFIGSSLARRLSREGVEVVILDSFTSQVHGKPSEGSESLLSLKKVCEVVPGDVRRRADWEGLLDGADAVVHLAAETGTGQSMYEIEHYTDVNIQGTSVLLDLLKNSKNGVGRLVVASSRAIYGEGKYSCDLHGVFYPKTRSEEDIKNGFFEPRCPSCGKAMTAIPTDEESRIAPTSVYGITKQVQEQMVLLFGEMTGVPSIALRYQNVYGPGQSLKNPYTGILSIFSTTMLCNNNIDIFEDGLESRDFVYIDDVVEATVLALGCEKTRNAAINVGSGAPVSVLRVAESLKRLYGSKSLISVSGRFRVGDIRHNYADLTRARELLGYESKVGFDEGLGKFVEWVKTQQIGEDGYEKSISELKRRGLYK